MRTSRFHIDMGLVWSSTSPNLYSINATVHEGSCTAAAVDDVQVKHGFRETRWDPNDGFFLNKQHFKIRGFCDHNNFAVVGMAVPKRVNLFRAQASRAVGGNGRRTSHNPPDPAMLQIYDRIGITVMDENRLFANETKYVTNMGALVKRDRNHPSVVIWSFCNEGGCEGSRETGGPRFQDIARKYDGTRATLANMFTFNDLLSHTIDVQGFSHQNRQKAQSCHQALPNKPIFMSECCSCNTMRDQDEGCETLRDNPALGKALVGAWFELMAEMGTDSEEGQKARAFLGEASATDQAGYEAQLAGMKMFWQPADAVAFIGSDEAYEAMDSVRQFSFDKGLLGEGADSPDFVGIAMPDGKTLGDTANIKLRFDTEYMQMAADGAL